MEVRGAAWAINRCPPELRLAPGKKESTISKAEFSRVSGLTAGHVGRLVAKNPKFALTQEHAEQLAAEKRRKARAGP